MKVSKAIEYLSAYSPDEEIIIEWITKDFADTNEWGCEFLKDPREYQDVPKEVWSELVSNIQFKLEWEEMGNAFADFIHKEYVSIMNNKTKQEVTT